MTGNIKIIKNNKLHKLFSKGPKFREPQEKDFDAAKGIVTEEIETFIKTLSNTKRLAPLVFDDWKFSLLDLVNNKHAMRRSLDQLVVETLGVASVRSSGRASVRNAFSRKPLMTIF